MALILASPARSRTTPTKLTTPPISVRPVVSAVHSAPTSKSSRCTRIISLPAGDRREDGDLVAGRDRMIERHIGLVHRDADDRQVLQRLGVARRARFQP